MRERSLMRTGTKSRAIGALLVVEKNKVEVSARYCEIVWKTWLATRNRGCRRMYSDRRLGCLAVNFETRCGVPCCIYCCPCFPRAGPVGHGASLTDAPAASSGQYILDGGILYFGEHSGFMHGVRISPVYGLDVT